ncbi:TMEM165/GDT1 family protein [Simiduia agarivorans]|uniref:GDT1 family protein n=1 Tax=Simiduia agarivorans (strain DSM 21679 / JCM 13881 / BCRC 17597 / SA1) TaxID=1117647 RepID=K4KN00_SIMAS|nr:TMEM165/GDT1 family protein [Simiduia agarivorans]AFV00402.1 integral membrane protein [Simiduia agarivorans SA1 = DSM 21679]
MDAFLTSTFAVALAEIGDKTQLLALLLTLRFRNKLAICAGILAATLLNHAASAWLGVWLGQFLQSGIGQGLLGASFIALGLWLLIPDKADDEDPRLAQYGALVVTFILFFLAEIGDKTQVATVALAAQYQSVFWVTLGTTLGMLLANVPVVFYGEALMRKLPMVWAHRVAAALFVGVGVWVLWSA